MTSNDKKVDVFEDTVSVREASRIAGVKEDTVRRWVALGHVEGVRPITRGSSRLRVNVDSLRAFLS